VQKGLGNTQRITLGPLRPVSGFCRPSLRTICAIKRESKPAWRHHPLRRSHFSLEAALPLALPYLGRQTLHIFSEPPPCQRQVRVNSPAYLRIPSRARGLPQNRLRPRSPARSAYRRPLPSSPQFPKHLRTRHAGRAGTKACSASTVHH